MSNQSPEAWHSTCFDEYMPAKPVKPILSHVVVIEGIPYGGQADGHTYETEEKSAVSDFWKDMPG